MIKRIVVGLALFVFATQVLAQQDPAPLAPVGDTNQVVLTVPELQQRRDALRAAVQAGRMPPPHDDKANNESRSLSSQERTELRQQLRQQRREATRPSS